MITRRDIVVAAVAISVALCVVAVADQPTAVMSSAVFDWDSTPATPTSSGSVRQFFKAPTATLDQLEVHVTTLSPGQAPHAPHRHPNEELLVVKEGTIEVLVDGAWKKAGPGSVALIASNQLHGVRNSGAVPATYHVIGWYSPGMLPKQATQ